jgi:hypothetical protein
MRSLSGALSGVLSLACVLLALSTSGASAAQVTVLARVPAPGYPSASVLSGATIYTGTFKSFTAPKPSGPSKVFAFSGTGALQRSYAITGQATGAADGVQVATVDRAGTLYLLDQDPARIITLNPRTGAQSTWATFSQVPVCSDTRTTGCSDGLGGAPEPDFAAWGPDGSLYVTDYNQSLIWRVPPGGGAAQVWLTDSRFDGLIVGPAGIQLMADGHTLLVSTGGGGSDPATGKLYTVPILAGDTPGALQQLWASSVPAAAPDGFAIARSGDIYLSEVGPLANNVLEISPQGRQLAEFSGEATGADGALLPFDAPGSVTFDGDNVIVTNEASLSNDINHWALLEIAVGQPGLPESLPPPPVAPLRAHHNSKHHTHHRRKRHRLRRR